jgi:hypothetical protein
MLFGATFGLGLVAAICYGVATTILGRRRA